MSKVKRSEENSSLDEKINKYCQDTSKLLTEIHEKYEKEEVKEQSTKRKKRVSK